MPHSKYIKVPKVFVLRKFGGMFHWCRGTELHSIKAPCYTTIDGIQLDTKVCGKKSVLGTFKSWKVVHTVQISDSRYRPWKRDSPSWKVMATIWFPKETQPQLCQALINLWKLMPKNSQERAFQPIKDSQANWCFELYSHCGHWPIYSVNKLWIYGE